MKKIFSFFGAKFIFISVVITLLYIYKRYVTFTVSTEFEQNLSQPHYALSNTTNHTDPINEEECPVDKVIPQNSSSHCMFVLSRDDCKDNEFYLLYYCVFVKVVYPNIWIASVVFFIVGIFLVIMMFYMIADTADAYFAPAIVKICDYLKLPSAVAGVTLLAFGNGSPDLFSILAGLMTQNTSLALSAPIGAGVFVSGVVFGLVIIFSTTLDDSILPSNSKLWEKKYFLFRPAFKVDKKSFLRDLSFYIIAICVVFSIYMFRFTNIFGGLILISIYILYVLLVIFGRLIYIKCILPRQIEREIIEREMNGRKNKKEKKSLLGKDGKDNLEDLFESDDDDDSDNNVEKSEDERAKQIQREVEKYIEQSDDADWTGGWNIVAIRPSKSVKERQKANLEKYTKKKFLNVSIQDNSSGVDELSNDKEDSRLISSLIQEDYFKIDDDDVKKDESSTTGTGEDEEGENCCKSFFEILDEWSGWSEMGFIEKVIYVVFGWYTRFVRDLFTPKSEKEEWNKWFTSIASCLGVVLFFVTFFKLLGLFSWFDWSNWLFLVIFLSITLVCGIIFTIIVLATTRRDRQPIYMILFNILAFFVSICWIYICAETLVKILTVFGTLIGIPPAFLGLTVLAWGNSFPDMVSNVVIARKGYPQMAVGSCVGEPLLNSLIGVGMLFTWMSITNLFEGKWCYNIEDDPALLVSLSALLFQSVMSFIVISVMKFKVRKWYGFVLIGFYFLQLSLALCATFIPQVAWLFSQVKIPFIHNLLCA